MHLQRWYFMFAARLRALLRPGRLEEDLDEEFRFHLDRKIEEGLKRGLTLAEARHGGLRSLDGISRCKEACREVTGFRLADQIGQDVRYSYRSLRKSPGFSVVAILTLMIGVGTTTALFSVVNGVILRPLPYADSTRLAALWTDDRVRQIHEALVSYPNYQDWQKQASAFQFLALCTRSSPVTMRGSGDAERVEGAQVSEEFFAVLGVDPILGRTFSAEESRDVDPVVVISDALWRSHFAGAPNALGQSLELDGRTATVIGVMPASFQFPSATVQLWRPLRPNSVRQRPVGLVVGRLKPEATISSAQSEMEVIGDRLARQYPELASNPDFSGFRARVIPLDEQIVNRSTRVALWVLLGAVTFVLLIARANVANLSLARGTARQPELAVRAAIGASRRRLVAQLLTESLVIAFVAGALGVALAALSTRGMVALAPPNLPRLQNVAVDARVLVFALGLSSLAGICFGLVPAWQLAHGDPNDALKSGSRGQVSTSRGVWTQNAFVASEFALALLLLCGAGLLVRSFLRVQETPLGFKPESVVVARIVLPNGMSDQQKGQFYSEALERLRNLAGVTAVGAISNLFLTTNPDATVIAEGRPETASGGNQVMDDSITPGTLVALGVPLQKGRLFQDQDGPNSLRVAIVNETLAKQYWPNEDVLGKRFKFGDGRFDSAWVTIVGVVGDMKRSGLEQNTLAQVFLPMAQMPSTGTDLVIRTTTGSLSIVSAIRQETASMNRDVPVYRISTLEQRVAASVEGRRFQVQLLGLFAALAVLLAAAGIYGVMHYVVTQRTGEMGIRLAVGATGRDLLLLVLLDGLKVVLFGLAAGLAAAWVLTRSIASLLYNVKATDPATLFGATLFLITVALVACLRPAWRASRLDPRAALLHR